MANIKQVAARAGLSVACVSKYLKNADSVLPASRERIEEAILDLNYTPSATARSLRTKRTYTVKAIMESITNPFFAEMFEEIKRQLEGLGYTTILQTINSRPFASGDFDAVDGVIICFPDDDAVIHEVNTIMNERAPIVCLHWHSPDEHIPTVRLDVKQGMMMAAEYLIRTGCHRLYYVGGAVKNAISAKKFSGFLDGIQRGGLEYDERHIYHGDFTFQSGYRAAFAIAELEKKPDGIACENDVLAAGVIRGLSEQGIHVPEDMHVTGFDNIPLSEMYIPALTSIVIPSTDMCHKACEMLQSAIDKKAVESCWFYPALVIRQS